MSSRRIGPCMRQIVSLIRHNGPMSVIDVAFKVGPHNSLCYGYQSVSRAVSAGLVKYTSPLPGRHGKSLSLVEAK